MNISCLHYIMVITMNRLKTIKSPKWCETFFFYIIPESVGITNENN